jgi:hypothetical protein
MRTCRKATLLLRRNPSNDHQKEEISYKGYDICWSDGRPTSVSFAYFCSVGMRTIFGKAGPWAKEHPVDFCFCPCDKDDASYTREHKCRRMYCLRYGDQATFYFHNGIITDMVFFSSDDPRVLDWIGYGDLQEGVPQWFDFYAVVHQTDLLSLGETNDQSA